MALLRHSSCSARRFHDRLRPRWLTILTANDAYWLLSVGSAAQARAVRVPPGGTVHALLEVTALGIV